MDNTQDDLHVTHVRDKIQFDSFDLMPLGICIVDKDMRVVHWNKCIESWTNVSNTNIFEQDIRDYFPEFKIPKYTCYLNSILHGGPPAEFAPPEHQHLFPSLLSNGEPRLYHIVINAVKDANTSAYFALFTVQDVTEHYTQKKQREYFVSSMEELLKQRNMVEQALRESEALSASLSKTAQDAVIMINSRGVISSWNPVAEKMFAIPAKEAIGDYLIDLIVPKQHAVPMRDGLYDFAESGKGPLLNKVMEAEAKRKDGSVFPVEMSVAPLRLQQEWHAVAHVRDISLQKINQAKINKLNNIDPLTKLNNKRSFKNAAQKEFNRARRYKNPLSILMVTPDQLDTITASYGQNALDALYQKLSDVFRGLLRAEDTAGRISQNVFAIILPETPGKGANTVALRLKETVEHARVPAINGQIIFTVSVGVAELKEDHANIATLLQQADVAMYLAKKNGGNKVQSL